MKMMQKKNSLLVFCKPKARTNKSTSDVNRLPNLVEDYQEYHWYYCKITASHQVDAQKWKFTVSDYASGRFLCQC